MPTVRETYPQHILTMKIDYKITCILCLKKKHSKYRCTYVLRNARKHIIQMLLCSSFQ